MSLLGPTLIDQGDTRAAATVLVDVTGAPVETFPVTGTIQVGNFPSQSTPPTGAVLTTVTYATGAVPVLAANPARKQFLISNPTNKTVNIAYNVSGAASGSYTFQIVSNATYEGPLNGYLGAISAFWVSAPSAGPALHITELS